MAALGDEVVASLRAFDGPAGAPFGGPTPVIAATGVELPDGRAGAIIRLAEPVATFMGDRGVLRRPSPGEVVAGLVVLDPRPGRCPPPRDSRSGGFARSGRRRRRCRRRGRCPGRAPRSGPRGSHGRHRGRPASRGDPVPHHQGVVLAPDVRASLEAAALAAVATFHRDHPLESGLSLAILRPALLTALRRHVPIGREDRDDVDEAVAAVLDALVTRRQIARDGDQLRDRARAAGPAPGLAAAMDALEALLDAPAPPDLSDGARAAGCPPEGIRALEAAGRIVRVADDLAWATPAFHRFAAVALQLARRDPLTPAVLRDATGTSRRVVMPLLEDLNRRGILARTPAGHVPGPRAPREPAGSP